MLLRLPRFAAALLAGALGLVVAPGHAERPAAASAADSAPQPKIAPLLQIILADLAGRVYKQGLGDPISGLFGRLRRKLRGDGETAAVPTPAPLLPAVGYTIEQLDPGDFTVRRQLPVGPDDPVLRTGDVFALQYSTSLPGQVRLENVDPAGHIAHLGTYDVAVDQLNRLPLDQGIQLQGTPGLERLRLYFYPCVPPESLASAWAAPFVGRLPACGRGSNGSPQIAAAAAGVVTPRWLVNLSQPDPTLAFAGADDYRPNEVLQTEVRLRHEGRQP